MFLSLNLLGGKKKKKKKPHTTPYKPRHKHVKVEHAVLQLYSVEGDKVVRLRKTCPEPQCGPGIYMARHFDRHYCGKCGFTLKLDPSQIKPQEKKASKKDAKDAAAGKDTKKDAKKGKKKK